MSPDRDAVHHILTRREGTSRIGPVLIAALLLALTSAACDDDTTGLDADTVRLEGTVEAMFDEGPVPGAGITVDVVGASGERVWAVATTDSSGAYVLDVSAPGGCAGDSVDAPLRVTARDPAELRVGGFRDPLRLACGTPNPMDLTLYRNVFRDPQPVAGDLVPTQLSVGREHACAITETGAYCWGASWYGRLGNASATGHYGDYAGSPVAVTNGQDFVQIAAGNEHTCALDADGAPWCWGSNWDGRVGADPSIGSLDEPYAVDTDLRFVQIAAGRWQSCGLTADGAVYCWGDARGVGTGEPLDTLYTTPQPVLLDGSYTAVSSVFSSTCAVRDTGEAYCWGFSYAGELGGGEESGQHPTPVRVAGDHTWSVVDAGVVYGCGLTTAGAGYCWGRDFSGRTGTGGDGDSNVPVAVAGGHDFAAISAGEWHTCAITSDGTGYCWGDNSAGGLGIGPDDGSPPIGSADTPVPVPTDLRFATLQTGGFNGAGFTCGVTTGDALVCWGRREYLGAGMPLR